MTINEIKSSSKLKRVTKYIQINSWYIQRQKKLVEWVETVNTGYKRGLKETLKKKKTNLDIANDPIN